MKAIVPVVVAALALAGCHDEGPIVPAGPARLTIAEVGPVHEVIGGGPFVREDLEGVPRGTYTFQAQRNAAGSVGGQAEVHFATIEVQVHIDIQCLAIERNLAWLSGPVTRSNDPTLPVGKVLVWQVQDNGEGEAVLPDRISAFAWLGGTGNYAPDVCRWKSPMTMRSWENGSVRILTPSSLGLSDIVGTWDVTKYICVNLANPADTQSLAGAGMRMRQTIAPNGRYTSVWWIPGHPGRIVENSRGWIDVVDGVVRVTGDGSPMVLEVAGQRTGNVWSIEFDGNVCHWDADGEEDPSHVVGELRLKRTGTLVDDVAGTWDATVYRFTSKADPSVFVDQVAEGIAVTLTLELDSHYIMEFRRGQDFMLDEGEMIFEGNEFLSRKSNGSEADSGTFELRQGVLSIMGDVVYDFDGDPATPPEPAILEAVLVRR